MKTLYSYSLLRCAIGATSNQRASCALSFNPGNSISIRDYCVLGQQSCSTGTRAAHQPKLVLRGILINAG